MKGEKTLSQLKRVWVSYKRSFICTGRWEQFSVCKTPMAAKTKIPAFIIRDRSLAWLPSKIYVSQISSHLNLMVSKTSNSWLFFSEALTLLGLKTTRWRKMVIWSCDYSHVLLFFGESQHLDISALVADVLHLLFHHLVLPIQLYDPLADSLPLFHYCYLLLCKSLTEKKSINCDHVHHKIVAQLWVMYIDGCKVSVCWCWPWWFFGGFPACSCGTEVSECLQGQRSALWWEAPLVPAWGWSGLWCPSGDSSCSYAGCNESDGKLGIKTVRQIQLSYKTSSY